MTLYPHTKRVDFKTHVDWNEREHFMKVDFPTVIRFHAHVSDTVRLG